MTHRPTNEVKEEKPQQKEWEARFNLTFRNGSWWEDADNNKYSCVHTIKSFIRTELQKLEEHYKVKGEKNRLIVTAQEELRERIVVELENKRDCPHPYSADMENPRKHWYQNEGYAKGLSDAFEIIKNTK